MIDSNAWQVVWEKPYIGRFYDSGPLPKDAAGRLWMKMQNDMMRYGNGFEYALDLRPYPEGIGCGVKRVCDAHVFEEWIRESHRLPQDARTLKQLNVKNVLYSLTCGFYRAWSFDFEDASSYEKRGVYCDCEGNGEDVA